MRHGTPMPDKELKNFYRFLKEPDFATKSGSLTGCERMLLESFECFTRRLDGLVEIFLRVGNAHEAGFVLRRGEVDPCVEHAAEELGEDLRCLRLDVAEVEHFFLLEIGAEHAADPLQ